MSTIFDVGGHFQFGVETFPVGVEVLLEGLVVAADGGKGFALLDDDFIVATLFVAESLNEFVQVFVAGEAFGLQLGDDVTHTALQHDECEEGHHEVGEFALLNSRSNEKISSGPNLGLVLHYVTEWCRIGFRHRKKD